MQLRMGICLVSIGDSVGSNMYANLNGTMP